MRRTLFFSSAVEDKNPNQRLVSASVHDGNAVCILSFCTTVEMGRCVEIIAIFETETRAPSPLGQRENMPRNQWHNGENQSINQSIKT